MSITYFLFEGIARHSFLIPGIHGGRGCPKSELKLSSFIVEEPKHRKTLLTIVLCFVFHVSFGATPSGAHGFLLAVIVGPCVWDQSRISCHWHCLSGPSCFLNRDDPSSMKWREKNQSIQKKTSTLAEEHSEK